MKRFFLLTLALVMAISLCACGGDPADTTDTPDTTDPIITDPPITTDPPVTTDPPETTPDGDAFIDVNEVVYVYGTGTLNIRAEASTESEKMGEMREGEQVTRTGYTEEWSRISYYGKTYYASSKYLTTTPPLEYEDKSDTLYVGVDSLKLYVKASLNADWNIDLGYGATVTRTGVSKTQDADGKEWSRINYNGATYFVPSTSLIAQTDIAATLTFTEVQETVRVIADQSIKLRDDTSTASLIVAWLQSGDQLERTGIATAPDADNIVWSRVVYNGKVCYASSSLLSNQPLTADSIEFTDVTETVYVTADSLAIRSDASLTASIIDYVVKDTKLDRTGIATAPDADEITWSRVIYNGKVCYAGSGYLTTTEPAPAE